MMFLTRVTYDEREEKKQKNTTDGRYFKGQPEEDCKLELVEGRLRGIPSFVVS